MLCPNHLGEIELRGSTIGLYVPPSGEAVERLLKIIPLRIFKCKPCKVSALHQKAFTFPSIKHPRKLITKVVLPKPPLWNCYLNLH